MFGGVLLLLFGLLYALNRWQARKVLTIGEKGTATSATVTDLRTETESRGHKSGYYETNNVIELMFFTAGENGGMGSLVSTEVNKYVSDDIFNSLARDQEVPVVYNPGNPNQVVLESSLTDIKNRGLANFGFWYSFIFYGLGGLCLVVGLIFYFRLPKEDRIFKYKRFPLQDYK